MKIIINQPLPKKEEEEEEEKKLTKEYNVPYDWCYWLLILTVGFFTILFFCVIIRVWCLITNDINRPIRPLVGN